MYHLWYSMVNSQYLVMFSLRCLSHCNSSKSENAECTTHKPRLLRPSPPPPAHAYTPIHLHVARSLQCRVLSVRQGQCDGHAFFKFRFSIKTASRLYRHFQRSISEVQLSWRFLFCRFNFKSNSLGECVFCMNSTSSK